MQEAMESRAGSIQARLLLTRFRPTGFDYLRIGLSLLVVLFHLPGSCYGTAAGQALWTSRWHVVTGLVVPAFFALSGFLVSGSLERSRTIFNFLGLRAIRILPALAVEVILSALILGPIVTSFPLTRYFASHELHIYALNIIGRIHYVLPGVFLNNPTPRLINGQLWTIPYELKCYFLLSGLALFRLHQRRVLFLVAVIALQVFFLVHGSMHPTNVIWLPGNVPIGCFLAGVAFYLFRDKLVLSPWIALACGLFAIGSALTRLGMYAWPFPVAYMTIWLGTLSPRKSRLLSTGDYSYGIYLFGFPVEQTVAWLGSWTHNWVVGLAISLPVTIFLAVASYHLVEKHALAMRRFLPRIEARFLRQKDMRSTASYFSAFNFFRLD